MDKPTKPTDLMPRSFGGIKNNFSDNLQSSGYEPNVPAIYGGDNLNYQLDATGKELDYCEKIVDFINDIPIGKTISVDNNNKLVYADLTTDVSNKANIALDNLSVQGESRLHALKSYVDEGEILNDAEGLAVVKKLSNDNFDDAKFTSLTPIPSNGVATRVATDSNINAVMPSFNLTNSNSWEIVTPEFKITGAGYDADCWIINNNQSGTNSQRILFNLKTDNSVTVVINRANYTDILRDSSLVWATNDRFIFKFTHLFSSNTYSVYYKKNGADWVLLKSVIDSNSFSTGVNYIATKNFNGIIDLKTTYIKVDGTEVFNGKVSGSDTFIINGENVKIPYLISQAGVKIVDSAYRTQINNLYEQQGYADYYTLDEENGTFTLPMGDLASLRAQKENTINKVNELNDSETEYPTCFAVKQALSGASGFTPYCANSGNIATTGDADIVATNSIETVIPYAQPILTENGTAGVSSLAVKFLYNGTENEWADAYNNDAGYVQKPYKFFDGKTSIANAQYFYLSQVNQLQMTFKDAVCLTKIEHLNISGGTAHYFTGLVKASNDGVNWTTLLNFTQTYVDANNILTLSFTGNTTNYTYYILQYTASNWTEYGNASCPISELRLTGTIGGGAASTQVFFKVGGDYSDLTLTNADNSRFNRNSLTSIDVSTLANGTYNVFVDKMGEEYLANIIYRQNTEPASPNAGDVWVNTSIEPLRVYKYTGSLWDVYNKIPIGSFAVTSGAVSAIKTFPYNANGVTRKSLIDYDNDGNGYHIEWRFDSYTHRFRKYCEQWGVYSVNDTITSGDYVINLANTYTNSTYNKEISFISSTTTSDMDIAYCIKTASTTGFTVGLNSVTDATVAISDIYWKTSGYLD